MPNILRYQVNELLNSDMAHLNLVLPQSKSAQCATTLSLQDPLASLAGQS